VLLFGQDTLHGLSSVEAEWLEEYRRACLVASRRFDPDQIGAVCLVASRRFDLDRRNAAPGIGV
jgi:hypothetical protein